MIPSRLDQLGDPFGDWIIWGPAPLMPSQSARDPRRNCIKWLRPTGPLWKLPRREATPRRHMSWRADPQEIWRSRPTTLGCDAHWRNNWEIVKPLAKRHRRRCSLRHMGRAKGARSSVIEIKVRAVFNNSLRQRAEHQPQVVLQLPCGLLCRARPDRYEDLIVFFIKAGHVVCLVE